MTAPTSPSPPGVSHQISNDGLRLTSTYTGPEGTATAAVSWTDLTTAEANYGTAARGFEHRIENLKQRLLNPARAHNSISRITRRGRVQVYINTGPPTWWLPRIRLRFTEARFGWLRVAVAIRLTPATPARPNQPPR